MEAKTDDQIWLRTKKFQQLAVNEFGPVVRQYVIAQMLRINSSNWSSCRNGQRPLPPQFTAAFLRLFPGVPVNDYILTDASEATTAGEVTA